ncbi:MAG: hypothetical protein O2954_21275, partial [bacterium]|nr:hypothetical protein [bacterium]
MLFSSLFKSDKQISVSKGRKRNLTIRDVVANLDKLELTTANCTLIRDSAGNAKIEDYGQVDIYRVRDEKVFIFENGFAITAPTGMKIREVSGNSDLAQIVAEDDTFEHVPLAGMHAGPNEEEEKADLDGAFADGDENVGGLDESDASDHESDANDHEEEEEGVEEEQPEDAVPAEADEEDDPAPDPDAVGKESAPSKPRTASSKDAYSDSQSEKRESPEDQDAAFGLGEVIRLRFFFKRIPFEIDCQILDRFNPVRFKSRDLTPRFGVGYHVRPLSDVRKRDQRRYVRYTHKLGFGHLRIRNEIQFAVYAHRTDLEIPEKGVLSQ